MLVCDRVKGCRHGFTVFTPTFNRRHTLHRPFESLVAQTFRDFEWVIVDDGSPDGTADLCREFSRGAGFPIRDYYQENRGNPAAINKVLH